MPCLYKAAVGCEDSEVPSSYEATSEHGWFQFHSARGCGWGRSRQRHLCVCVLQRWGKEERDRILFLTVFLEDLLTAGAQCMFAEGVNDCMLNIFTVPCLSSWPHPLTLGFLFGLWPWVPPTPKSYRMKVAGDNHGIIWLSLEDDKPEN